MMQGKADAPPTVASDARGTGLSAEPPDSSDTDASRYLAFGPFVLDLQEHLLWQGASTHYLTPQTFKTLSLLLAHPGDVVSKRTLLEQAWPETVVTENALTRVIKEIRQTLNDPARDPRFVETVPRMGYRFLAEVHSVEAPTGAGTPDSPEIAPGATNHLALNPRRRYPILLGVSLAALFGSWLIVQEFEKSDQDPVESTTSLLSTDVSADAYLEYAQGRELISKRTEADRRRAVAHFRRAIQLEPDFAAAYSGLADALIELGTFLPPRAIMNDAISAIQQALMLEPDNVEARVSLAQLEGDYLWDFEAAEVNYHRALADYPDYLPAYRSYAIFLVFRGRADEALQWLAIAREQNPLSPETIALSGWAQLMLGHTDEADDTLTEALELAPDHILTHLNMGLLALRMEDFERASDHLQTAIDHAGDSPDLEGLLGYALARNGQAQQARTLLKELEQRAEKQYITPMAPALIYLGLGDREQTLRTLKAAYADRNWHLIMLQEHFLFDVLRGDGEFEQLVARVGPGSLVPGAE